VAEREKMYLVWEKRGEHQILKELFIAFIGSKVADCGLHGGEASPRDKLGVLVANFMAAR